jgi:hypothetical protein
MIRIYSNRGAVLLIQCLLELEGITSSLINDQENTILLQRRFVITRDHLSDTGSYYLPLIVNIKTFINLNAFCSSQCF